MVLQKFLQTPGKSSEGTYKVYDRFTFDNLFRVLLNNDYEHEEALDFILGNCSLSTIVFQERIYNNYYLNISTEETISDDLIILRNQTFLEIVVKITEAEIESIAEQDFDFIINFVVNPTYDRYQLETQATCGQLKHELSVERESASNESIINQTYEGYKFEIQTIYGQLQRMLHVKVKPASDEWDRLYNVDFFIEIKGKYIGLQIKPTTFKHTFEDYKWKEMQEVSHRKFQEKFYGRVFTIFSVKEGKKKVIHNPEVIEEIRKEIERLKKE